MEADGHVNSNEEEEEMEVVEAMEEVATLPTATTATTTTTATSATLDDGSMIELPDSPDMVSPKIGMMMRSGRKKRRRSKETSGMTPDETTATVKKKKRTSSRRSSRRGSATDEEEEEDNDGSGSDGGEDDNDEEQQEEEEEQEEDETMQDTKIAASTVDPVITNATGLVAAPSSSSLQPTVPAPDPPSASDDDEDAANQRQQQNQQQNPVAPTAATATAAYTTASIIPPQALRMPSQQTPGKNRSTPLMLGTPYDKRYQGRIAIEDVQQQLLSSPVQDPPFANRNTQRNEQPAIQHVMINGAADVGIDDDDDELEQPRVETPVRRLFRSIQTTIKEIIVPNPEGLELDADDDDSSQSSSPVLSRTYFWFIVLFFVQAVCYQYWINPIMTGVDQIVESSILFYKEKLGVEPPTIIINKTIEVPVRVEVLEEAKIIKVPAPAPLKRKTKKTTVIKKQKVTYQTAEAPPGDEDLIQQNIEQLVAVKEQAVAKLATADDDVTQQLNQVKTALLEKRTSLEAWDAALSEVEEELKDLLKSQDSSADIISLPSATAKLQQASPVQLNTGVLLSSSSSTTAADDDNDVNIPMWEVVSATTGCPQPPSSNTDNPLITKQSVQDGTTMLKQRAQETVRDVIQDPETHETIKEWVSDELEKRDIVLMEQDDIVAAIEEGEDDDDDHYTDDDNEMGLVVGITQNDAKQFISDRLDGTENLGDMVGLLDVASLYNGAEVIQSGSTRATTPSLAQSLPLLNRFLAATKLRFYGHGPEAALSPTIPPDSLGQCWSFENVAQSKNPRWRTVYKRDKANGQHATLTIRLAKPTAVARVIIDHVLDDGSSSAIRNFRVIGYADSKAQGAAVGLGSFHYQLGGPVSQQFEINGNNALFQSITLAIDNTYSKEYACLYRFRVLKD